MGLDMTVFRVKRVEDAKPEDLLNAFFCVQIEGLMPLSEQTIEPKTMEAIQHHHDELKTDAIVKEAIYWRKTNAVHGFFVRTVQHGKDDCGFYKVRKYHFEDLLEKCNAVLNNHSLAKKLLPVCSGVFFGTETYDVWYYKDLKYTAQQLTEILDNADFDTETYFYHASW